ncbi:MAG: hypothetical protein WCP20_24310 [Desulfuromonadales bacterium]
MKFGPCIEAFTGFTGGLVCLPVEIGRNAKHKLSAERFFRRFPHFGTALKITFYRVFERLA